MLLALTGASNPSVIRIRQEGLKAEPLVGVLQSVLPQCHEDLKNGAMVTVQDDRARVRRLPLVE